MKGKRTIQDWILSTKEDNGYSLYKEWKEKTGSKIQCTTWLNLPEQTIIDYIKNQIK
jgi:predicted NodU family carbamoyl transferase